MTSAERSLEGGSLLEVENREKRFLKGAEPRIECHLYLRRKSEIPLKISLWQQWVGVGMNLGERFRSNMVEGLATKLGSV